MILSDFRYQDPWAEENFTLPDFIQQSQAQQRYDQQAQLNCQALDTLLVRLSQKDIIGLDHAKEYLRHKYLLGMLNTHCRCGTYFNTSSHNHSPNSTTRF